MSLDEYRADMARLAERHTPFKVTLPEATSGSWSIQRFEVKVDIQAMRCWRDGRPIPPGIYTKLVQAGGAGLFMSDTPAELNDAAPILRQAAGHVLITGLGLGMIPLALLAGDKVEQITVVEKEGDVIKLVSSAFEGLPVAVIHADAFEWKPPAGTVFDWAWHDIWPDMCSDYIPEFAVLRRRFSRFMAAPDRQLVWCEYEMRRSLRRWA